MADAEQSNKTTPTPQRRPYHQNRPNYTNRGRGRPDSHVSKALHNFGVTDLREWLDKKHQQDQSSKSGRPPPDPSYSYLKDPLRDNSHSDDQSHRYKEHSEKVFDHRSRGNSSRGFRGKRGGLNRDEKQPETEKTSYIENPVNIKVELTTATGERSYKVDEDTKLADIKHVPDRKQQERRSFRGERDRGNNVNRGRFQGGRGRGESGRGRGDLGRGRGELGRGRGEWGRGRSEWGRGRGELGSGRGEWSRGRGRGEWGRGRGERGQGGRGRGGRGYGRGKYNSTTNRELERLPQPTIEMPTDENWDECVDQVPVEKVGDNLEEINPEEYYDESEYSHEYYEGDDYQEAEGYENSDASHPTEESESTPEVGLEENSASATKSGSGLALEENLIIESSKHEENVKRMVRFKLEEERKDEETKTVEKQATVDENLETEGSTGCGSEVKSDKTVDALKSNTEEKVDHNLGTADNSGKESTKNLGEKKE